MRVSNHYEPHPRGRTCYSTKPRPGPSYVVYVDGIAARCSDSLDAAEEIASAYVQLGRALRIERREDMARSQTWIYDYGRYEWVKHAPDQATHTAPPSWGY